MRVIHEVEDEPLLLKIKSRDNVLVGEVEIFKVLSCGMCKRSTIPDTLASRNLDTGQIKFFHGDEVSEYRIYVDRPLIRV